MPLLSAALERVEVPRGRRFGGERCPPCLREAMEEAEEKKIPVLLMFPGPGAMDVKDVAERGIPRWVVEGRSEEEEEGGAGEKETTTAEAKTEAEAPPLAFGPVRGGEYILVAVDGTWHQGKQMFRVSSFCFYFVAFFSSEKKKRTFDAHHFFVSHSHSFSLSLLLSSLSPSQKQDLAPWFLAPRGPAIRIQLPIGDAAEDLSEEAAAAVARAEEERRRAAASAATGKVNGAGGGGGDGNSTAPPAPAGVTRNICADTRTIALFKEPFEGCMTTAVRESFFFWGGRVFFFIFSICSLLLIFFFFSFSPSKKNPQEAIARALAELEPTQAPAAAVLSALNAVVDSQKRHDPAVRARCGEEEEEKEKDPKLQAGNAGRGESWHRGLHERRERKRVAKAARDAAAGIAVDESAQSREEENKKKRNQNKNKNMSAGLADGRNKFGFKNPPSNSCAECAAQQPSAEEKAARKAEKLAARIENRRRKQAEAAAAVAAATGEAGVAEG